VDESNFYKALLFHDFRSGDASHYEERLARGGEWYFSVILLQQSSIDDHVLGCRIAISAAGPLCGGWSHCCQQCRVAGAPAVRHQIRQRRWLESSRSIHAARADMRGSATIRSRWLYRSASSYDASRHRTVVVYFAASENFVRAGVSRPFKQKNTGIHRRFSFYRKFTKCGYPALMSSSISYLEGSTCRTIPPRL